MRATSTELSSTSTSTAPSWRLWATRCSTTSNRARAPRWPRFRSRPCRTTIRRPALPNEPATRQSQSRNDCSAATSQRRRPKRTPASSSPIADAAPAHPRRPRPAARAEHSQQRRRRTLLLDPSVRPAPSSRRDHRPDARTRRRPRLGVPAGRRPRNRPGPPRRQARRAARRRPLRLLRSTRTVPARCPRPPHPNKDHEDAFPRGLRASLTERSGQGCADGEGSWTRIASSCAQVQQRSHAFFRRTWGTEAETKTKNERSTAWQPDKIVASLGSASGVSS